MRALLMFAFFGVLTVIGLVGGWLAAKQADSGATSGHGHEEDAESKAPAKAPGLSARTLANLGVRVEPARKRDFTRYHVVQAVVLDRPRNRQPVAAPLGGIVTAVHVDVGDFAEGGAQVVTISRDPITRPKPELTADVLTPISEEVHDAVARLRGAQGNLKIVDQNLARVRASRGASDGVTLLRKSEIDLQNERARIELELDAARHELERHGLKDEEIAAVEAGRPAPPNVMLWQHALETHGLWPQAASAIRAALPAPQRDLPWVVVAIGELSAAGLAGPELAQALKADARLSEHFGEAAGLLLEGTPLATVQLLAREGALAAEMVVSAPDNAGGWDVTALHVRPGERVDAGSLLLELHDPQGMWLDLAPVGEEIELVVRAYERGSPFEAAPLLRGSGPRLEGLTIERIIAHVDEVASPTHAICRVANTRLVRTGEGTGRSWAVRAGTRYLAKVPVGTLPGRFVIPASGVARRGTDRLVFVQDGATFRAEPVRVEYEDDEVVVVPDDGLFFDGDPIAVSGAFPLMLALQLDGGGDAHQEHGHAHD